MKKKLLITNNFSITVSKVFCNTINNINYSDINFDKFTCALNLQMVIDWNDLIISVEWLIKKWVIVTNNDNGKKCY